MYGVCVMKGYVYFGMSEQFTYFVYKWIVISICDPFFYGVFV